MDIPVTILPGTPTAALLTAFLILAAHVAAQTSTLTTIHTFRVANGSNPDSAVAIGSGGVLYGTTKGGGTAGNFLCGTVFSLTPPATGSSSAWTESVLHDFNCSDGQHPVAPVVIGNGGVLYGATNIGGASNDGTVFALTPPATPGGSWTATVLHNFRGGADGADPAAGLTMGEAGVLYGTTTYGGSGPCTAPPFPAGCGTVFKLTPPESPGGAWTETVIYSFPGGGGGLKPFAGVTIGSSGMLYGTTSGGNRHFGTVFSLTPPATPGGDWTPSVLHNFTDNGTDGFNPEAGVVIGGGGVIYGTTRFGGTSHGGGTVFSLTPPESPGGVWTEAVIHNFTGLIATSDGYEPTAGLVIGSGEVLYGTTFDGGASGFGTVFSLSPPASPGGPWTESTIYSFTGGSDGANPAASVAIGSGPGGHPVLYGAAYFGGTTSGACPLNGCGTLFSAHP
ncbi:MAG: choice-of-anchor tandem repeat GloVer-containing protein [Bryobacteraceae bacterium]|jgi:uncharacterized repeat protein (TIGR03803 family)